MMKGNRIFWVMVLCFLLAAGCSAAMPAETVFPLPPTLIPTITVPPLPSPTSWSTRTPLPTLPPTPTPPLCWKTGGILVEETVETDLLAAPVEFLIYLPPCYYQLTDLSYPALYLLHGQGYSNQQWVELGLIDLLDRWVATGESPPALVVLPQVSDWGEPDQFAFGQAMVEHLIPAIEGDYRAVPARESRKVGGISRGASWALHLGLKYWQTFSAFGGHSLPIFYADAPLIPYWLDAIPVDERPQIYLDYAESDQSAIRRSVNRLIRMLDERGVAYRFYTAPGIHDQEYWGGNLEEYLRFYLEGW
ncbi:MAG TPA: alpha/beta hydrolase-fold protein [Anaerolineales bacterium]|nr:alpha/beta hydrolase-fold protein [Anaerolineales bacterium]